ncbi:MAG: hypothetical protein ABEJ72_11090, partial [Candidatus Aenigmatarchaeota archaeon]
MKISLEEFYPEFEDWLEENYAANTADSYARNVRFLVRYAEENDFELDTEARYEFLDFLKSFFNDGELTKHQQYLYQKT